MKTPDDYNDDLAVERLKLANADTNDGEKLKKIQDRIKVLRLKREIELIKEKIRQLKNR